MSRKKFRKILFFLLVFICLFILDVTNIKASEQIWSLSATTDCSHQGGTNGNFTSPCRNMDGTNFTDYENTLFHDAQVIRIPVVIGHHYHYQSSASNFSFGWTNGNADYIAQQISSITGLGGDYFIPGGTWNWYCSDTRLSCNPTRQYSLDFIAKTNYVYLFYFAGCDNSTGCYLNNLSLTDESVTDNPSPSPTSHPISKVLFIPGLGASWNADALLNCKPDSNTDWVLAPYAEDIYKPVLQAINEVGWVALPFYYDWRKPVSINSKKLADYIDDRVVGTEKINVVGHSMGGLVGRDYNEVFHGSLLSSLLTVGSPNKGSALAYPPWAGGDIWTDNLLEKIALTLYLKHCGGLGSNNADIVRENIPSLQNLLPIYAYLQNNNEVSAHLPSNMLNKNEWLSNLSTETWGVRLGYIAGTGYDTLEIIKTKNPSNGDLRKNKWIDGKPIGNIIAKAGDGTVLTDSAILPNVSFEAIINQTHSGLLNSFEGISKILEFLGNPKNITTFDISKNIGVSSNSALILIGYPANFVVIDQNGLTKQDKDGMVSFINPKSGKFKVNLLPKSNETLFIVAQFLPNGDIKYKEYTISGINPIFKTLKLDLLNPKDDILLP